jgi:hypothetical protein
LGIPGAQREAKLVESVLILSEFAPLNIVQEPDICGGSNVVFGVRVDAVGKVAIAPCGG